MCDFTCTKYLVFFFNFLFWILGLAIAGVGCWAALDKDFIDHLGVAVENTQNLEGLIHAIRYLAVAFIILGAIIAVIGFFGCCGAIRESQCCLVIFFILLLVCFVATVAIGGILMFVAVSDNAEFNNMVKQWVDAAWSEMSEKDRETIENKYKCCGSSSDVLDFNSGLRCAGKSILDLKNLGTFKTGCFDHLLRDVKANILIVACVVLGVALIEFLGMTMALILCCGIKRAYAAV